MNMNRERRKEGIALYLSGEISEEMLLSHYDILPDELEDIRMHRYLGEALREEELLEFQRLLLQRRMKDDSGGNKVREPALLYKVVAAAALILLILLIAKPWVKEKDKPDIDRQLEMATLLSLDNYRDAQGFIYDSLAYFIRNKNFPEALGFLGKNTETGSVQSEFLRGLVYYEMKDWKSAALSFTRVTNDADNLFVADAHWMRALVRISEGNRKAAIADLDLLAGMPGPRARDAKELLDAIGAE